MGGRNIGVAVDFSSCSKAALRWASTNLARSGDQLVLIHVNNSYQNEQGAMHLWEQSGSPLIPLVEFSDPHVTKKYGLSPDKETLEILAQVAHQSGVPVFFFIFHPQNFVVITTPDQISVLNIDPVCRLSCWRNYVICRLRCMGRYSTATRPRRCARQSTWFPSAAWSSEAEV
uniref:UspA domain-containing protein n=2 Tax=Aegilops tauschii subsp. strangulata TaxID=200361 RepID=A0A453E2T4_AEGTS